METVKVTINGKNYMVQKGSTILQACKNAYIDIPSLCYMKGVSEEGSCGLCVVEIKGQRLLKRACITKVVDGMEIYTNTEKVRQSRKMNLALILSTHKGECPICGKYFNCELREICERLSLREVPFETVQSQDSDTFLFNSGKLRLDTSKCILCQRCVKICSEILQVGVFSVINRGIKTNLSLIEADKCIGCGQCSLVCPTEAIHENNSAVDITKYREIAIDRTCFHSLSYDEITERKFITALRRAGFERVYSFDELWRLSVDDAVREIKEKLSQNKKGIVTTFCVAWEKYLKLCYPDFLNVSAGFHPVKLLNKNILPVLSCVSIPDAITMNQLLGFLNQYGMDIKSLPPSEYDSLYNNEKEGFSGKPEDFVKKILKKLTNSSDFQVVSIRGLNRVREITTSSPVVKATVTDSLYQAKRFLERIKKQKSNAYQIIHVVACPEGCIGGGGISLSSEKRKNISGSYYGVPERKRLTR